MTLGCSRKSVRLLTFRSSSRIWPSCTNELFVGWVRHPHRRARQSARGRARPRHLRSRAQSPLSRRAGTLRCGGHALPHSRSRSQRQSRIRRRSRAENTAERLALRDSGRSPSLPDHWEQRWADTRIHGTTKRQVAAMLPKRSPRCCHCRWSPFVITSTASASCIWMVCVEVEAAYYGAPPGWIGRVLRVQWDELYDIWKG